jgi:hypothetical protein
LNFFFCILSFLKPFVEDFVIASHHNNEIEPFWRKDGGTMKINNDSSILRVMILLYKLQKFVLIKDGHIEVIIPFIIEFVLLNDLTHWQVLEVK